MDPPLIVALREIAIKYGLVLTITKGCPDEMIFSLDSKTGQSVLQTRIVFLGVTGIIQFYSGTIDFYHSNLKGSIEIPDYFEPADERLLSKFSIESDFSPNADMISWLEKYLATEAFQYTCIKKRVYASEIQRSIIKMQETLLKEIISLENKVEEQEKVIRSLQKK